MDPRVEKLFAEYGKSFSSLEMRRTAEAYAEQFVAAGPKGVISQGKEEFLKNADEAAEFYRSLGQEGAELLSARETWYSQFYVMVTVHWGVRFASLPDLVEFDVSYLVQLTDDTPRIILFISHTDEEETMKELGLLKGQ